MKILLIDNYDSFTYILYQYLWEICGEKPLLIKNNAFTLKEIQRFNFQAIVISPGPGHPENARDFGVCAEVIHHYANTPLLGVCLGHQGLGLCAGAKIIAAPEPCHGKVTQVFHQGHKLFHDLPSPFAATRYHSLVIDAHTLPVHLETIAFSEDQQIMGIQWKQRPSYGVQFHPESIGTPLGKKILNNFVTLVQNWLSENAPQTTFSPVTAKFPLIHKEPEFAPDIFTLELPWQEPEQVFAHLFQKASHAFWLDGEAPQPELHRNRFSFMGEAAKVIETRGKETVFRKLDPIPSEHRVKGDPFFLLKTYMQQRSTAKIVAGPALPFAFNGGLVGYFGYEMREFTGSKTLPTSANSFWPDALFFETEKMLGFDREQKKVFAVFACPAEGDSIKIPADIQAQAITWFKFLQQAWPMLSPLKPLPEIKNEALPNNIAMAFPEWKPDGTQEEYFSKIKKIKMLLQAGESYEACLTQELRGSGISDPFQTYRLLRKINPAPYSAYLQIPGGAILSVSPERFLKLENDRLSSKPIKGTRSRGSNTSEDEKNRDELVNSVKERSENLMITDLLRNDFGKVCEVGSVQVPSFLQAEAHPTVWQLVSEIQGKLSPEYTGLDAVRACFPGGSMTGAPKLRTLEILEALEKRRREVFSGALGYMAFKGDLDFSIVIRTICLEGNKATIGCGGAILLESEETNEYAESWLKAYALMRAWRLAKTL